MKSFEALQKSYEKEIELSEKHKQNAADIKKEIEMQRGKALSKKINSLNLSGQEYDKFLLLLDRKKNVMEAVDMVLSDKGAGGTEEANSGQEEGRKDPALEGGEEERGKQEMEI